MCLFYLFIFPVPDIPLVFEGVPVKSCIADVNLGGGEHALLRSRSKQPCVTVGRVVCVVPRVAAKLIYRVHTNTLTYVVVRNRKPGRVSASSSTRQKKVLCGYTRTHTICIS